MALASARRVLAVAVSSAGFRLLHPAASAAKLLLERSLPDAAGAARCFATRPNTYFLRGKVLHCSDKDAKSPVLLNGRDFEHWLVVMEPPAGDPRNPDVPRDEIINSYIKTLALVVGSDEKAKQCIYSVSTRCYFAFGAQVSEDLSLKLRELPNVKWVLPDSFLYPDEKNYGGEPFVNGEAAAYDCKYHSEWLQNDGLAKSIYKENDLRHNPATDNPYQFVEHKLDVIQNEGSNPSTVKASLSPGGDVSEKHASVIEETMIEELVQNQVEESQRLKTERLQRESYMLDFERFQRENAMLELERSQKEDLMKLLNLRVETVDQMPLYDGEKRTQWPTEAKLGEEVKRSEAEDYQKKNPENTSTEEVKKDPENTSMEEVNGK